MRTLYTSSRLSICLLLSLVALLIAACPSPEPQEAPPAETAAEPLAETTTPAPVPAQSDTLAARIAEMKAGSEMPDEVRQVMAGELEKLRSQGISATAVSAGQSAPDFSLSNQAGEQFSLADTLAQGPAVLVFFRGAW